MKKMIAILICTALLCLSAFACAESVGMANPVVPVSDDDEFEDVLNIDFDSDELYPAEISMSIINNNVGQVRFTLENVNGENIEWTLRFTRDDELAGSVEAFSGIYDADMSEPETKTVPFGDFDDDDDDDDDDTVDVVVTMLHANTENYDIHLWDYRGVHYCLTIGGDYSQMQFAEVADGIIAAIVD